MGRRAPRLFRRTRPALPDEGICPRWDFRRGRKRHSRCHLLAWTGRLPADVCGGSGIRGVCGGPETKSRRWRVMASQNSRATRHKDELMKTLILLAAILGVVTFGVIEQHQHSEAADREAAEQQLHRCWQVAMSNDGV